MSIPKEPRQLMINIMYLVLTALLALNVSAEILNAFITVNEGIESSNGAIDQQNQMIFEQFDKQANADGREKSLNLLSRAEKARDYSVEFCEKMEYWKNKVVNKSGGYKGESKDARDLKGKKDYETTTLSLIHI